MNSLFLNSHSVLIFHCVFKLIRVTVHYVRIADAKFVADEHAVQLTSKRVNVVRGLNHPPHGMVGHSVFLLKHLSFDLVSPDLVRVGGCFLK